MSDQEKMESARPSCGDGCGESGGGDRREFIGRAAAALGAGLLAACDDHAREAFFQRHFKELSQEDLKGIVQRLEEDYKQEFGKDFTVATTPAQKDVLFGYALDLSRCVGCRRCVYACVEENNLSRDPQVHWITVLEMDKEHGVSLSHSNPYYDHETVPAEGKFYMPVACQQCRHPQCTAVCPVGATWQEPDGIVVVDYNWCIGCRYCMAACPYGARHFNWGKPHVPADQVNPVTHYLGNRPRYTGVMEKCTFCIQRVRSGRYPACVEVCPAGARKFGNLLDPKSEVRYVIENKRVFILKEEINTQPKFYYFYGV